MIKIKCIGGPFDGKVRVVPEGLKPLELLVEMSHNGWGWEIDYSKASQEEVIAWGGADLMQRAVRAVENGRTVTFLGTEYSKIEELQDFEDAIVYSGYMVRVAKDDDEGVVVDIIQPE